LGKGKNIFTGASQDEYISNITSGKIS